MRQHRAGFTLVEILVVLAIIAILSALLFPVFNRARERGRQTNCASNLQQIYTAIRLYYDDEKRYPASLRDLLPSDAAFPSDSNGTNNDLTAGASDGHLRGGRDVLLCPSDDTESQVLRSSYGNIAWNPDLPSGTHFKNGLDTSGSSVDTQVDPARFVYNAYGYDTEGWAYTTPSEAETANGGGSSCSSSTPCNDLLNPNANYNVKNNPVKYSLSNRLAPPETIITHCIFHRTWTSNVDFPGQLYNPSFAQQTQGSRDIVLRLDGKAKLVDVTNFKATPNLWQHPAF
jgi:prepilin-type N-terminal cleavage/methylation domain-containing protein